MSNPFDQFDSQPTIPVQSGPAAQPAPSATSNPFDQFDSQPTQEVASLPTAPIPTIQHPIQSHSFQGFVDNLGKDFHGIGEGLGALSTASAMRYRDAIMPSSVDGPGYAEHLKQLGKDPVRTVLGYGPSLLSPIGNPLLGQKPLFRPLGNQSEPSDIQTAARVGGDIVNTYGGYLKDVADSLPAVDVSPQGLRILPPTGNIGSLGEKLYQRPLSTGLDLLPLADGAFAAEKGAVKAATNLANKVPATSPMLQGYLMMKGTAQSKAGALGQALVDKAITPAANAIGNIPIVKQIGQHLADWSKINKLIGTHDAAFRKQFHDYMRYVQEAYDKVKNVVNETDLYDIVTMADPKKFADAMVGPHAAEIQDFQHRLGQASDMLAHRLKEAGAITEEEQKVATYGPYVKARRQLLGQPDITYPEMYEPTGYQEILQAEADIAASGQTKPVYMSQMTKPMVDTITSKAGQLFGGVGKTVKKAAVVDEQAGLNATTAATQPTTTAAKPMQFVRREHGVVDPNVHSTNPMKVFQATLQTELGYLHMRDLVDSIVKEAKASGRGEPYKLQEKLQELAANSGYSQIGMMAGQMTDAVIDLPPAFIRQLDHVMSNKDLIPWWWNWMSNTYKNATLGLRPAWSAAQNAQNMMLAAYSMFKGPDDMARSIMAFAMAFDKRSTAVAQSLGWVNDIHGESFAGSLAKLGSAEHKNPVKWFIDKNYAFATAGDNYARTVKGLHELMRQVEKGEPASRVALAKAYDIMARFDQVGEAAKNAKYAEAALKDVKEWFFDYGPAMADKWAVARALDPFFLWHLHSFSIIKAARNTPVKNMVLSQMARTMPDRLQAGVDETHRKEGFLPMYGLEGDPLKGPNGGQLLYGRSGFAPVTQPLELIDQAGNYVQQNRNMADNPGLPALPPFLSFLSLEHDGKNPSSMRDLYNPSLTYYHGKAFKKQPDGTLDPVGTNLNWAQSAVRALAPTQEAYFRNMATTHVWDDEHQTYKDYMPSDFTNLTDANPKRGADDKPLLNFTPTQQQIYSFTGMKPTEVTRSGDEVAEMKEREQRNVERTKDRYQTERSKPIDSSFALFLKGGKRGKNPN